MYNNTLLAGKYQKCIIRYSTFGGNVKKNLLFPHTSAALETLYSTPLHGFRLAGTPKTD